MSAHENNVKNDFEARILNHKEVDEQIRIYIAPLTTQAEDLTWLTQGMSTAQRPNLSPRAGTSGSFGAEGPSLDSNQKDIQGK